MDYWLLTDRQTGRQEDKQTDTQTHTHTFIHICRWGNTGYFENSKPEKHWQRTFKILQESCQIWCPAFLHFNSGRVFFFLGKDWIDGYVRVVHLYASIEFYSYTSSIAQGGGWSFRNRKPIGEVSCCDAWMAVCIHWWTERWLELCFFGVVAVVTSPTAAECI